MNLLIENLTNEEINFDKNFERLVLAFIEEEDLEENLEVSLTFVDKDEIRRLNKEYREIDKVTDVLSFPIYENEDFIYQEEENLDETIPLMLGDIVICIDVAKEQAQEYGHSLEREVTYLACHSILHLLGYDHMDEDDKEIMRSKEKIIMKKLGVFK